MSYEIVLPDSINQQPTAITERRIKSDRIRLLANPDGEAVLHDGTLVSTILATTTNRSRSLYKAEDYNPNINKATGI